MATKICRTSPLLEKRLKEANKIIEKQKTDLLDTQEMLMQTYEENLKLQNQLLDTQEVIVSVFEEVNK